MSREIVMPNVGAAADEATLVEWLVTEGDEIAVGQPLFEVESDKVTLVIEASEPGRVARLLVNAGATVPVGSAIALLDLAAESAVEARPDSEAESALARTPLADQLYPEVVVGSATAAASSARVDVSPRARALATELGVDLAMVVGTGPNGRIVEADIRATHVTGGMASPPISGPSSMSASGQADATLSGLRGHRAVVARRMTKSARTTAAVTLTREVAADAIVAARERLRAQHSSVADALSFDLVLAVLVARALGEHPALNTSLGSDGIVTHEQANIGIAIDGESGLVVPVVRNAGARPIEEIAKEWRGLRERARTGAATPTDLSGGTFTITNLGHLGVDAFTPIINLGECAVLGVGRMVERPIAHNGELGIGQVSILSLTFDHRLVDGASAAKFLAKLTELIEHPDRAYVLEQTHDDDSSGRGREGG
jgi:pyruvate dehydrogenase E2 component (dihydrolipoamide acetyltransferase)